MNSEEPSGVAPQPGAIQPGEALDLAGCVSYQQGSIVSRTICDGETATITLFAFDAGQGLSEHTTPYDAYVVLLDGEGQLVIGQKPLSASTGQIVLMPSNVPHAVRASRRFKMMLIMIRE